MDVAKRAALLSFAERRKVGCIAVKDGNILGYGFNGTPAGHDNKCEDDNGVTLDTVVHAEDNLIKKLAADEKKRGRVTGLVLYNCDVYVTKEPCLNCAKLLHSHDVKRVFFTETSLSKAGEGIKYLEDRGVMTYQF
jgi:dCMP deaminase